MELFIPEILAEARHLSLPVLASCLAVGLALWLAGWWSYRFWVALLTTVAAGVVGLYEAAMFQMQPLLAALLLAVAAGLLALSLMRLFAFAAAGVGVILLARVIAPSVDAPWVCFLAGGILATIMFRLWVMALTSFLGSLVIVYSGLCLLEPVLRANAAQWGQQHAILLNSLCLLTTVLGAGLQYLVYRRRSQKAGGDHGDSSGSFADKLKMLVPFRRAA
jgi:hypothetical protein